MKIKKVTVKSRYVLFHPHESLLYLPVLHCLWCWLSKMCYLDYSYLYIYLSIHTLSSDALFSYTGRQ